jgi:hypothetical protein
MKLLKNPRWKQHPWAHHKATCEVRLDFLISIANPNATTFTDLLSGEIVHQNIVFDDIEQHGMAEPLLIVICWKKNTIRLESGNHRIHVAHARGYTHLPCSLMVIEHYWLHEGNGQHYYPAQPLIGMHTFTACPYPYLSHPSMFLPAEYTQG